MSMTQQPEQQPSGAPEQQTAAQQRGEHLYPPTGSNAQASDNPLTMDQPGTGVEQSRTSEQTMEGQPVSDYLAGGPVVGDDVVVEAYEIDTLPPELGGQPVPDETVSTPPPNPANPDLPPEGTTRPVSNSETPEGGETPPPQP
jgi:hypothetical protein